MSMGQRVALPDSIRTNGASPNPWWANAVVYQIYPRSFQDSNGDGIGDLPGIISRLDYLEDLGVDVLWLSPVYRSPQDDNGYDISDYRDIDPMFGTLDDMDELLSQAHQRGLKVVMDLVVNHTSDEHAWFQESRDPASERADWYWWRPARPGCEPGTPGAEPNRWGSIFGGSAWQYDPARGEYFLHLFSKKQPDLNWENPQVRQAVFDMMNWWLDRGVDGFRMDVISLISKRVDVAGRLPGEPGSELDEGLANSEGFTDSGPWISDGPRLDEFLADMRRQVFEGREGFLTVGEAPGISPDRNRFITDPANGELDMLFLFDQIAVGENGSKWDRTTWDARDLKRAMAGQQEAVRTVGWPSLFLDNHDQPRLVSRFGDDSDETRRVRSAKALALLLHLHRGTPYVYQGEELGMTNAHFTRLGQYRDLESLNLYRQRVGAGADPEQVLASLAYIGRDNARTPMQWDSSKYAGFTASYAPVEPWIEVNPNRETINAKTAARDEDSVLAFYKRLIALRHTEPVVAAGDWELLDADDPAVYAFTRSLPVDRETVGDGDGAASGGLGMAGADLGPAPRGLDGAASGVDRLDWAGLGALAGSGPVAGSLARRLLVVVNLSGRSAALPSQSAALISRGTDSDRVLLSNYDADSSAASLLLGKLSPWEALVYRLD